MADLVITAASVVKGTTGKFRNLTLGATVTAGQVVYKDAADSNKAKLADADSATSAARVVEGIALNGGAANQPVAVLYEGLITIGAVVTVGKVYALSDVAGGIRPIEDNGTGDYVCIIGIGVSATQIDVQIQNSGVAVP